MELTALHQRVIDLDVHQAQITACALIEQADGTTRLEQRRFGAFKRDRRALVEWAAARHEHYRDSATDYEALAVQRNAPRWIKALTRFGFSSPPQPDLPMFHFDGFRQPGIRSSCV